MKISAMVAVWLCAAFALVCLGVVVAGLLGMDSIEDPALREAAWGYVGFWGFLAAIAVVFGALSWMISRGKLGPAE